MNAPGWRIPNAFGIEFNGIPARVLSGKNPNYAHWPRRVRPLGTEYRLPRTTTGQQRQIAYAQNTHARKPAIYDRKRVCNVPAKHGFLACRIGDLGRCTVVLE